MNKVIGIIIVIVSIYLVYIGISTIGGSETSVDLVGVELSATDESAQSTGIIYTVLGIVGIVAGGVITGKKPSTSFF